MSEHDLRAEILEALQPELSAPALEALQNALAQAPMQPDVLQPEVLILPDIQTLNKRLESLDVSNEWGVWKTELSERLKTAQRKRQQSMQRQLIRLQAALLAQSQPRWDQADLLQDPDIDKLHRLLGAHSSLTEYTTLSQSPVQIMTGLAVFQDTAGGHLLQCLLQYRQTSSEPGAPSATRLTISPPIGADHDARRLTPEIWESLKIQLADQFQLPLAWLRDLSLELSVVRILTFHDSEQEVPESLTDPVAMATTLQQITGHSLRLPLYLALWNQVTGQRLPASIAASGDLDGPRIAEVDYHSEKTALVMAFNRYQVQHNPLQPLIRYLFLPEKKNPATRHAEAQSSPEELQICRVSNLRNLIGQYAHALRHDPFAGALQLRGQNQMQTAYLPRLTQLSHALRALGGTDAAGSVCQELYQPYQALYDRVLTAIPQGQTPAQTYPIGLIPSAQEARHAALYLAQRLAEQRLAAPEAGWPLPVVVDLESFEPTAPLWQELQAAMVRSFTHMVYIPAAAVEQALQSPGSLLLLVYHAAGVQKLPGSAEKVTLFLEALQKSMPQSLQHLQHSVWLVAELDVQRSHWQRCLPVQMARRSAEELFQQMQA